MKKIFMILTLNIIEHKVRNLEMVANLLFLFDNAEDSDIIIFVEISKRTKNFVECGAIG